MKEEDFQIGKAQGIDPPDIATRCTGNGVGKLQAVVGTLKICYHRIRLLVIPLITAMRMRITVVADIDLLHHLQAVPELCLGR